MPLYFGTEKTSLISLTTSYTNAKVLLVGDSGVGKTGLAVRLTEDRFEQTISTDAHWATQLKLSHDNTIEGVDREIWLWDFAGQSDYRLIHQLFMDETALAVLVFNPQSENPFEGLKQWDREITRAAQHPFKKLLVAGRCDRGTLRVSRDSLNDFIHARNYTQYLETSALQGNGCQELKTAICEQIDWEARADRRSSPRIFKLLKDEILRLRDQGIVLLRMGELKQQMEMRLPDEEFTLPQLRTVVGLLVGPGLVWKIEFGDFVLLQPSWINRYAAAVIRSIRELGEIGVISEDMVLKGDLNYVIDYRFEGSSTESQANPEAARPMKRLGAFEESIVLRSMHQTLVDRGICTRASGPNGMDLIFPSYFKRELPDDPSLPPLLVTYRFNGFLDEIYATLVVRLYNTPAFENGPLWRYAADFYSPSHQRMGLKMTRLKDDQGEISVYFETTVSPDLQVMFTKYVHEHLIEKAKDIFRFRHFTCPHCGHPVRDTDLVREILEEDGPDAQIRCQKRQCDKRFPLWDLIEQKFASPEFQKQVRELEKNAKTAIDNESKELILVGHAFSIAGEAGQIFRPTPNNDWGIDGEIKFKDREGKDSGQCVYLQLKSGDSYLSQREDGNEIFRIKNERYRDYWQQQAYPVMLVIRTSNGEIRWMNITEYLKEGDRDLRLEKRNPNQIIFNGEPFTALNLQRMRDRLIPQPE